jgi:hypothetical protein
MKEVKLALFTMEIREAMESQSEGIALDLKFSDAWQNLSGDIRYQVFKTMVDMLQAAQIADDEVDDDVLQASSDTADLFKRVQGKLQ